MQPQTLACTGSCINWSNMRKHFSVKLWNKETDKTARLWLLLKKVRRARRGGLTANGTCPMEISPRRMFNLPLITLQDRWIFCVTWSQLAESALDLTKNRDDLPPRPRPPLLFTSFLFFCLSSLLRHLWQTACFKKEEEEKKAAAASLGAAAEIQSLAGVIREREEGRSAAANWLQ